MKAKIRQNVMCQIPNNNVFLRSVQYVAPMHDTNNVVVCAKCISVQYPRQVSSIVQTLKLKYVTAGNSCHMT